MAISKKQAKIIAELINTCTVWHMFVRDETAKPDSDWRKTDRYMESHDKAGRELNAILGVEAIVLYNRGAV